MQDWQARVAENDPEAEEASGGIQLGLFTPERAEAEAGFAALSRLELDRAEELFTGMLRGDADNEDARCGLAAVAHWREVVVRVEPLPALDRAEAIWRAVGECSAELIPRTLRRRLLEEVLETLEMRAEATPLADLCVADVLVAMGRHGSARRWLEWATRSKPGCARLHLLRGDALYEASASEARACYSRGLLLDPTLERWAGVAWRELARRVRETGGAAVALEWWAAGRLPLPPPDAVAEPHPSLADRKSVV